VTRKSSSELRDELEALRPLELSEAVVGAALEAQAKLARHAAGFHRLPHQDYLVAAIAAAHELGVLHYDADFDRIAEHSSLAFESVWIASAGTLDEQAADPLRPRRRAITHSLAQFNGERAREVLDLYSRPARGRTAGGRPPAAYTSMKHPLPFGELETSFRVRVREAQS
jgi:hypothetical protein